MLQCTKCGRKYPLEKHQQRCPLCNEPLEVVAQRGKIREGKRVWDRFRDFYSYMNLDMKYSLGEGDTPLILSESLSQEFKAEIYFKNETVNPTWSFKDRGTFVALNRALSLGFDKIGVVSTGNMAASVAAYGARAGVKTFVLLSSTVSQEKISQIGIYGAKMFLIDGDYGALYFESLKIGERLGIYFMNSDDPFRIEGYKSIALEIGEIDYVIIPTSSGGLLRGIMKGFLEMKESGLIDRLPVPIAAQASGCAPICRAFREGGDVRRMENPATIAHAIENPYPPSGNAALRLLRRYDGRCVALDDEDIIRARRKLAKEGIFVQPASATAPAALEKLKDLKGKRIALILTGSGLKTKGIEYISQIPICKIENIEGCMGEI